MISEIFDAYYERLPNEIPYNLLMSAGVSAALSSLWDCSTEKVFHNAIMAAGLSALNSFVAAPLANYVFSDKSAAFKDNSALAISFLSRVSIAKFRNEEFAIPVSWSSIFLSFLADGERKPGDAFTWVVG